MCLWGSICNHCYPIKRSEDAIIKVAALPSLFNHPHSTSHNNQERQVKGSTLNVGCRKAALSDWRYPISQPFSPPFKRGTGQTRCADCQAASPSWPADEWSFHAAWWPEMHYPPSLSTSGPAASSEIQWSIIILAPLQHPKASTFVYCPLLPPLPGKQKG